MVSTVMAALRFSGRVALITGAGGGERTVVSETFTAGRSGEGICFLLASRGAKVVGE